MSVFNDSFKRASEEFLERVKESIWIYNAEIPKWEQIEASVDPVSFDDAIRSGGRTSGAIFTIHVRKSDWESVNGESGSKIQVYGSKVRAQSFVDIGDNQYEVMCESFKGASGL